MLTKRPSFIINKLVLVGRRKNYVVPFGTGVNIIYGDAATGKSSVLECINYLLGSSRIIVDVEIETSVQFVMMEVSINERPYVIRRDIFRPTNPIEVFLSDIESIEKAYPRKLTPKFEGAATPEGYFSDFMMDALGLPRIRMRQSPSKQDSEMVRLSFRDVLKFNYLRQDDVGSKGLLGGGNHAVESKNKETFKYIFNLLDANISDVQTELSQFVTKQKRYVEKYQTVSEFLRDTEFDSEESLTQAETLITVQMEAVSAQLTEINSKMVADEAMYGYLKEQLSDFNSRLRLIDSDKVASERAVDRYVRLRNDYLADVGKLKSIRTAKTLIGQPTETFSCPLCASTVEMNQIKAEYSIEEGDRASHEVNVLTKRVREIDTLIEGERDKQIQLSLQQKMYVDDRDKARRLLDDGSAQMITPYLSQRDGLSSELAKLGESRRQIAHATKVRNQQKSILTEIEALNELIGTLQEKLNQLRSSAPSLDGVLGDMSDFLDKYVRFVRIKDPREISISPRTFLPVLRGRNYRDITSGGLRTILSIGFYLSLLEMCVTTKPDSVQPNLPAFLMIDTVGKYLGKTSDRYRDTSVAEDQKEEVSDPGKYLNMYTYMFDLADRAQTNSIACQIILVDNDVPPEIRTRRAESIRAYFNSEGGDGISRGLIDDAHLIGN